MGSKSAAKALMEKAGVPVVPGYHGDDQSLEETGGGGPTRRYPADDQGRAGGGGKGMRIVQRSTANSKPPWKAPSARPKPAFGDDHVLLEHYIQQPRHIEFQVFGDSHGDVVHLCERECSMQRRFQKVLEETPSPFLDEAMRRKMGGAAVAAARAVNYVNAGTLEFIVGHRQVIPFHGNEHPPAGGTPHYRGRPRGWIWWNGSCVWPSGESCR